MEIVYSRDFVKSAKILPKTIKIKLTNLLEILKNDIFNPKLHLKPLTGKMKGFYSIRITRDFRVILNFTLNNNRIFLIDVGHRKNIYK